MNNRMHLSNGCSGKRLIIAAGILAAVLAGCAPAEDSLWRTQTAAVPPSPTPTKTATPTVANTLARLPTRTTTPTATANWKYYDLETNYSILPPPGWDLKGSYHPNTYWWESTNGALQHERISWKGTKEAYYAKSKSELASAPQHKVLSEEDFTTDSGIPSHRIDEQYMGKSKLIRVTTYILPVGKDLLVFFYYRYADAAEAIDDTVQASINSVEILIPE